MGEDFRIWEGVYSSFAETGGSARAFEGPLWIERSRKKALLLKEAASSIGFSPRASSSHEYCVVMLAASLQATRARLRLLDFGGSVGFLFYPLVSALGRPDDVEVHVVDNQSICTAGRELFAGEPRITFHAAPPSGEFDLVHLGSSIQYVSDWASLVQRLVASGPEFLVFDDVPAGEIATFVSLQNYYGCKIPHWFFNVREFVDTVVRATGYRLFYKARYIGKFLDQVGPFPMENFPENRRIDNAYNLAFARPAARARWGER